MSCIKTILNLHEDFESKLSPVSFLSGGPYVFEVSFFVQRFLCLWTPEPDKKNTYGVKNSRR